MIQVIEHSITNDLYLDLHEGNLLVSRPWGLGHNAPERYEFGILSDSQSRLFSVE